MLTGTARRISTGQQGTFRTTCDWSFEIRYVLHSAGEFRELSGSGPQTCSWAIELPDGSLAGDMRENATLSLAGPKTSRYSMTMSVNVVGGTGAYARAAGGGECTHTQTSDVSLPGRVLAAVAPTARLDLTLREGKPQARLWPGRRTVRVVTVPGSSCRFAARKGKALVKRIVRDGDRDGLLILRLSRGRWAIAAACTHASARAVVNVR